MKTRKLYHGTSQLATILKDNKLLCAKYGDLVVSLSASQKVAEYFARLPRDFTNEVGVIVLDQDKLENYGHTFSAYICPNAIMNEEEFRSFEDIPNLDSYILDIIILT